MLQPLLPALLGTPLRAVDDVYELAFHAMGTRCRMVYRATSRAAADRLRVAAFTWLAWFEETFSRYREDSLVSRINAAAGGAPVPVEPAAEELFSVCDWAYWVSGGLVDPTVLPLLRLWDYKAGTPRLPAPERVQVARALLGWKRVERQPGSIGLPLAGMAVDVGGVGKEYAVDRVVELARTHGIEDVLVDFGQDLRVHGEPPEGGAWRIGLERPSDPGTCWGGVAVMDRAVCSSGDYHRCLEVGGKRYGHIVDPRTGYPVSHGVRGVTVVAPACTEAGTLCTAAFVLGPVEGLALLESQYQAEGCMVLEDGSTLYTRGFREYLL